MKDLLLTMFDVLIHAEAIFQIVICDNKLFERNYNKRLQFKIRVSSSSPTIPLKINSNPRLIS
jgi:hypothetical protein